MSAMTKIYFDTEFTGLHKDTTLISIGVTLSDSDKKFYGQCTDYDTSQVNDWIRENVISNLEQLDEGTTISDTTTRCCGTKENVGKALMRWIKENISIGGVFVSDVCQYDMVLLQDLIDFNEFELEIIGPCCHDINQDIAAMYGITEVEAFDMSRETIARQAGIIPDESKKHNALYDAEVIKAIDEYFCNGGSKAAQSERDTYQRLITGRINNMMAAANHLGDKNLVTAITVINNKYRIASYIKSCQIAAKTVSVRDYINLALNKSRICAGDKAGIDMIMDIMDIK